MVQILFVRLAEPGPDDSTVAAMRWYNPQTGAMGTTNVDGMIEFLRDIKGKAYVCNGVSIAEVVCIDGDVPYLHVNSDDESLALHNLPKMD